MPSNSDVPESRLLDILLLQYDNTGISEYRMKKHLEADALAARLSAAANQPPFVVESPVVPPAREHAAQETPLKQPKVKGGRTKEVDENTVPISLRPGRSLPDRYV